LHQVTAKLTALKGLDARLREIRSYLDLVIEGKLPLNHEILYHLQVRTIFPFRVLNFTNYGETIWQCPNLCVLRSLKYSSHCLCCWLISSNEIYSRKIDRTFSTCFLTWMWTSWSRPSPVSFCYHFDIILGCFLRSASLIFTVFIMCSENKWHDARYLSIIPHPECNCAPQLDQQQG